jgi:hypothetical protein
MQEGHSVRVESVEEHPDVYVHLRPYVPVSHAMALPLRGETGPRGAILAGRVVTQASLPRRTLIWRKLLRARRPSL